MSPIDAEKWLRQSLLSIRESTLREVEEKIIEKYGEWGDPVVKTDLIPMLTELENTYE